MENVQFTLPEPEENAKGMVLVGWYVAEYGKEDPRWPKPAPKEDDPHIKKAGTAILIDKSYVLTAIWKKAE